MAALMDVTQADRDAAQAFRLLRLTRIMEAAKDWKAGARLGEDEGDAGDLVQAFARHRLAHSEPRPVAGREDIARIVIGPRQFREPRDGGPTLRQLQDIRWKWASEQERKEALWIADSILATHSPAPTEAGEPVAWSFRLATAVSGDGTYSRWDDEPRLSLVKPSVPEGSIRDLTPLYALSSTQEGAER